MITCFIKTSTGKFKAMNEWDQLAALANNDEFDIFNITIKVAFEHQGTNEVSIIDVMQPTIQNLFLLSSKALLNEEIYSFNYWDFRGTVNMSYEGDNIVMQGDYLANMLFPKQELIKAFLDSAAKLMQVMRDLHVAFPEFEFDSHAYFEELHSEAKALYNEKYG